MPIYRPPSGNIKTAVNVLNDAFDLLNATRRLDVICLGDFNVDWLHQNDAKTTQIFYLVKKWNLLVTKQTRVTNRSETLIALLLHNLTGINYCGPISLSLSDHFPIAICKKVCKQQSRSIKLTGRCYQNFDETQFLY